MDDDMRTDKQGGARRAALLEAFKNRILVLDGAGGTYLQGLDLSSADFGGPELEGCNEHLVLSQPECILNMHRDYLAAGADIIETNTFGGTPLVLAEYQLADKTHQINLRAAQLARQAADEASTPQRPRWVAGAIGPTTKAITVTGGVTFAQLEQDFGEQAAALLEGGVDYLLVETCQDTRNVKAALLGIENAFKKLGWRVPVAVSGTIEPMGTMLAGQGVEAFYASIAHMPLLYVGLNCATGPAFMTDHLRSLAALAACPVGVSPNAGLPDEDGNYLETPTMLAQTLKRFIGQGWVNLIGGCCGTHPGHVQALVEIAQEAAPRQPPSQKRRYVSGIDFLELTPENRPVLVGERTNAVGSRLFKRLINEEQFEQASEIARRQVRGGAQVIDINLANPDRNELEDMQRFMDQVIQKVKVPLMIDSTDAQVIAAALPYCQGKAIINSINLEDGEERFDTVVPLARRYGAALIVGTIDEDPEQGMAVTRQRKLEIAERAYALLTGRYGVLAEDIIFDPLVFPCATGDVNYVGSAAETIAGIKMIKEALPGASTVLGISNVSFGLPPAGREVLNAVFLYHCVQAGLDMAIVNSEKLERYASLDAKEIRLSEALFFDGKEEAVAAFAAFYRGKKTTAFLPAARSLPLAERLGRYIVDGSKDGLVEDLNLALKKQKPLEIINGPLMAGMDEVGRLFNDNKLIVAEVLQSAEAMKAAVHHLEPLMEKGESSCQGKMVLATVKGDVHDIGKNLVEIIFSNNGYEVVNLGIKIPPEQLIAACEAHKPDLIGLSGLLVKSAQQMVTTAEDLHAAGIRTPILVGGAALSRNFTHKRIYPAYGEQLVAYASDAMNGLDLANRILQSEERSTLEAELAAERKASQSTRPAAPPPEPGVARRPAQIRVDLPIPPIPDTKRHVLPELVLDEIWEYINPQMLYGKHMGLRGNAQKLLAAGDAKAMMLKEVFSELKHECRGGWMHARAIWRFCPAQAAGNQLTLHSSDDAPAEHFEFPRQAKTDGVALPDFVLPPAGEEKDAVAVFLTTAGEGIRERAEALKTAGEYVKSHALQALALETAEAAAEWVHARIRAMWGFADSVEMTPTQRFQAKYRGRRYSPGYPACPQLEDQAQLFRLLAPERIGVSLTEGYMMEPEASVSALVFHHPAASYFSVGESPLSSAMGGE